MSTGRLDVWLYGTRVAQLREERPGRIELSWTGEAESRWGRGVRVLSSKLTVGETPVPPLVKAYVDGLLPEGNARINYAMSAGLDPDDTFGLVSEYGRDTPGAAIFAPEGHPDPTTSGRYVPVSLDEVADRLRRADQHQPASPGRRVESSTLPGMVPKITLHREGEQWFSCAEGAPSTWILKRSADLSPENADVVDTEVASLAIARELGLTTIEAEVVDLGDVRAIAVSRYDRGEGNVRFHQEDLAQALGLNTEDPNRKFQWGRAMPSLRHAADVLRLDGGDVGRLLEQVTLSFVLGNVDLHAKNISFMRFATGQVELTPAYDVAMHMHHPREMRRFAMDLDGANRMDDLTVIDVIDEGISWGVEARRAHRLVGRVVDGMAGALDAMDRGAHLGVSQAAWACVEQRVRTAQQFLPAPAKGQAHSTTKWSGTAVGEASRRGPRRPR